MGLPKIFSSSYSLVNSFVRFEIVYLFFFLQCSLLPHDFLYPESSSTDEYNPSCIAFKLYNTTCPNCKLNIEIGSDSFSLFTKSSIEYPYTNSPRNHSQSPTTPQYWVSNHSEYVYIGMPSPSGTMVLSQGLIFEFTDSNSKVYENFDDGFQLDQTLFFPSSYDSEISGTISGQLRNKSNFSEIINVSGSVKNFTSDYSPITCSNGM